MCVDAGCAVQVGGGIRDVDTATRVAGCRRLAGDPGKRGGARRRRRTGDLRCGGRPGAARPRRSRRRGESGGLDRGRVKRHGAAPRLAHVARGGRRLHGHDPRRPPRRPRPGRRAHVSRAVWRPGDRIGRRRHVDDITACAAAGASGVVVGKALYEGRINLSDALEAVESDERITLARRVIPCLDVVAGRVMKGVAFVDLRDAGEPLTRNSVRPGPGRMSLSFLTSPRRAMVAPSCSTRCGAPPTACSYPSPSGAAYGVSPTSTCLLRAGADKVSINTAALEDPSLIERAANRFGCQCVVIAIDARQAGSGHEVYSHGGRRATGRVATEWAREAAERGAGEILLTSMDQDGTGNGYDLDLTASVVAAVDVPVIASGGAGTPEHLRSVSPMGAQPRRWQRRSSTSMRIRSRRPSSTCTTTAWTFVCERDGTAIRR